MNSKKLAAYLSGSPADVPCHDLSDAELLYLARLWPAFAAHLGGECIDDLHESERQAIEGAARDLGFSEIEAMALSGRNMGEPQ